MKLAGHEVGITRPFFLIAGPCVIESPTLTQEIAGRLKELTTRLGIPYVFKASYDKANRSSRSSYRGPGIDDLERMMIFDKFYRGQSQRYRVQGTGMGLAIAKAIVEAASTASPAA